MIIILMLIAGILASLDLPEFLQTAPSVRSTRGRASKRDTVLTGQFVCVCMYNIIAV